MRYKKLKRVLSILLVLSLLTGNILTYLPSIVKAQDLVTNTKNNQTTVVVDPGTADTWETMLGTSADGNRYAGRVWVDKSVYKNGATAVLNSSGLLSSTYKVELEDDETFQIIFSALGSSMTTTTTTSSAGPVDVVLILDDSTSMDDIISGKQTRLEKLIESSNKLIADLLTFPDIRIGIVAYNNNAIQVLPFGKYENGIKLSIKDNKYTFDEGKSNPGGIILAKDKDGKTLANSNTTKGYDRGTNVQAGFDMGMGMLKNATNTKGRSPVAILLTDGAANTAVQNTFYNLGKQNPVQVFKRDDQSAHKIAPGVTLATLLNAAFNKAKVEDIYGKTPTIYGVGVDLGGNAAAHAIINPGATVNGFNQDNASSDIRAAYKLYTDTWLKGNTVTTTDKNEYSNQSYKFTMDHGYKETGVTKEDIANNIYYVDTYFDVTSAELDEAFGLIYQELTSSAFNPITSTQTSQGGTGVKNTPLIYVDNIGQYMEVKEIQAIMLFGESYNVVEGTKTPEKTTYIVTGAIGKNPTTNEDYDSKDDIQITVYHKEDGTQKLEIKINQEILPIILDKVLDKTISGTTNVTLNELMQQPLRVYYTVGIASDILLPNGSIDISKIDNGYDHIDGNTITFYSNAFGEKNKKDSDGDGYVELGDAHVGFKPSAENRYYYHQTNQGIFTEIWKDGKLVTLQENEEYGILWNEDDYDLTWMSYDAYENMTDETKVYTYVTYYRPTGNGANAEKVTYLVYTLWEYLKESIAFYNETEGKYINYNSETGKYSLNDKGYVMSEAQITEYVKANPNAEIYAVLGVGSHRTSRLHNMTVAKINEKKESTNYTGTAELRYAPVYTYETASEHNGNDVVVWMGNNGKITVEVETGIALTKQVTEAIGNADDTYALTVTIPSNVTTAPVVKNVNGKDITKESSSYSNYVLTVHVKAGETVYVSGIPSGTECEIGEKIAGDYYIDTQKTTTKVTIPKLSDVLGNENATTFVNATVTNSPNKYGNLYITKEITSDHAIPKNIENQKFEIIVNVGTILAGKTYTVKMTNMDNTNETITTEKTVDEHGNIALTIQATQTMEILRLPVGTNVTVAENLTEEQDVMFDVTYRTRNHSGEKTDTDNAVVIPADANATVVLTNQYKPMPTSVDLDIVGTKVFDAEFGANLTGGSFQFVVQTWDGFAWVDGKTASVSYGKDETGTKTFRMEDVLSGITYSESGSWSYQVVEEKGNLPNITYDRTLYTFTVTVVDEDGKLAAKVTDLNHTEITDGSYEVIFTNTYHTAPVSIDIEKEVTNTSGDSTVSKAGFGFTAVMTDADWNVLTGELAKSLNVYSDTAGKTRLTATYTKAGEYYYIVSENIPTEATLVTEGTYAGKYLYKGWYYDATQYKIKVVVTDSEDGNLTATLVVDGVEKNSDNATITFANIYNPKAATINLDLVVKKSITGKTLADIAKSFTFKVYENNTDTVRLTGTNLANGTVDFDGALTFNKVGKYEFDIKEMIPTEATLVKEGAYAGKYLYNGMYYDATIYDLVVEVTNDKTTGELVAVYYFEDSITKEVTFNNVYKPTPTEYTIKGLKKLNGRALATGEFTFELYEGNKLVETVTNKADSSFTFTTIAYDKVGTYTYTIKEVKGNALGITYDGRTYTVQVTVTDTMGKLSASSNIANENIVFENTYTADTAKVTITGEKELTGSPVNSDLFTFELHETDNTFSISEKTLKDTTTVKGSGAFSFNAMTYKNAGSHFYVVVEKAGTDKQVIYDITQYQFHVQVNDDGAGQLKATVLNLNTGVTTGPKASVTVSGVTFKNITFDEVIEKTVYKNADTTTMIDGKVVNVGEILTYYITYTNHTGYDVAVSIDDVIPAHTSYVEGSATMGGTYVGTHVNWQLNVAKGGSVTVSFKVRVNETNVIVANQAIIRDGINEYKTNEVHNYVPGEQKDVFAENIPNVSIDGEFVNVGDILTYKVQYINPSESSIDITIIDEIPEHTTYVKGSASHDAIYDANAEKLTWNLTVPAWGTVVVYFDVEVKLIAYNVEIKNTATVEYGENKVTTNEVTNYTPNTGDLTIIKDVKHDLESVPEALKEKVFTFEIFVGKDLAGKRYTVDFANATVDDKVNTNIFMNKVTVNEDGIITLQLKDNQSITIKNLPEGTKYTVTETSIPNGFEKTASVGDIGTIEKMGDHDVHFVNTYTIKKTANGKVTVKGTKTVQDDSNSYTNAEFTFEVQQLVYNQATGNYDYKVVGSDTITPFNKEGNISADYQITVNYEMDAIGTYYYRVVEKAGSMAGMTYDNSVGRFRVVVTDDDMDGKLESVVQYYNEASKTWETTSEHAITKDFVNIYNTDEVTVTIPVNKTLVNETGIVMALDGFHFELKQLASINDGFALLANGNTKQVTTDAGGNASFQITYHTSGTYYYMLTEVDNKEPGMTYDKTRYLITVIVKTIGDTNQLGATITVQEINEDDTLGSTLELSNGNGIPFKNKYSLGNVDLIINGEKKYNRPLTQKEQFMFEIYKTDASFMIPEGTLPLEVVGNDSDDIGNTKFNFTFTDNVTKVGTYYYSVKEVKGSLGGVIYDTTHYHVTVHVHKYNDTLVAEKPIINKIGTNSDTSGELVFVNEYNTESIDATITGNKVLIGREMNAGEFTFELYEGDKLLQETTNKANGSIVFEPITYTKAGTHTYTVKEAKGDLAGIIYATNVCTVTVVVTDNGEGRLVAEVRGLENVRFENIYETTDTFIEIEAEKVLVDTDENLKDKEFTFALYEVGADFKVTETSKLVETITNKAGKFTTSLEYSDDNLGTHYYVLKEIAGTNDGVLYDDAEYQFTVVVVDNKEGKLVATVTSKNVEITTTPVENNGVKVTGEKLVFTNVDDDEVILKDVFETNTTTSIDGAIVEVGQILDYVITYKNYAGTSLEKVTITDKIPAYTEYVENSVSQDGTYSNGTLTWEFENVAPGTEITVSFQVKVVDGFAKDTVKGAISNIAKVNEGNNEYTSNEVTNIPIRPSLVIEKTQKVNDADETKELCYVQIGDTITYYLKIQNVGLGTAVNTVVKDTIPSGLKFVSVNDGGVYNSETGEITWNLGNLDGNTSKVVSFVVEVPTVTKNTVWTNMGTVTADNNDDDYGKTENEKDDDNDVESNEVVIVVIVPEKDVVIPGKYDVSVNGQNVSAGQDLEYVITYKNPLNEVVTVIITDKIPTNTSYIKNSATDAGIYADGTITWTLTVPANGEESVSFCVSVNEPNVTFTNQADVVVGNNSYTTNIITNETKVPFVTIEKEQSINGGKKTKEANSVEIGDTVKYFVTVKNLGDATAKNVVVTDKVPEGLIYVEDSAKGGNKVSVVDGIITWELGELEAGISVTVSFVVKVPKVEETTFWKNVAFTVYDNNPENSENPNEPKKEIPSNEVEITKERIPQTGDSAPIGMWVFLAVTSLVLGTGACVAKKRRIVKK